MIQLKILEKYKTPEWYESVMDYYVPSYERMFSSTFEEDLDLYRFLNNDISGFTDKLNRMCNDMYQFGAAEQDILPYNSVKGKIERKIGEYIRRGNNHRMVLLSAKAIRAKNDKMLELLNANVQKDLEQALIKAQNILAQSSPQELEQFIQEETKRLAPEDINYKNYLSELEITKNKVLENIYSKDDIIGLKAKTLKHLMVSGKVFILVNIQGSNRYIEVLNSIYCGYDKSSDTEMVQKGSHFWVYDEMNVADFIDEYGQELKPKQWKDVSSSLNFLSYGDHTKDYIFDYLGYYTELDGLYPTRQGRRYNDYVGQHVVPQHNNYARFDRVKRTRMWFKAYKECIFYEYQDEYGAPIKVMMDANSLIVPENAETVNFINPSGIKSKKLVWYEGQSKHQVHMMFSPRRYEQTRINADIYLRQREMPFQPDYTERPYHDFELPVKGGVISNLNAISISPMQEAMTDQLQIMAVKELQNRFISQYEHTIMAYDMAQFPDELATDVPDEGADYADELQKNPIIEATLLRKKTRIAATDSSARRGGLSPSHTRSSGITVHKVDSFQEAIMMENFINMLDMRLGVKIGVTPQMEAMPLQDTNVTDNQQALTEASIKGTYLFYFLDKIWAHVLDERLAIEDLYWKSEFYNNPDMTSIEMEYTLPDGTSELLQITPEHLNHADIGLYLMNSDNDKMYKDLMLQKLMQNTIDPNTFELHSEIIHALTSSMSAEEIRKLFKKMTTEMKVAQQEAHAQQAELNRQIQEATRGLEEFKSGKEFEKILFQETEKTRREIAKIQVQVEQFRKAQDVDRNKVDDDIQVEEVRGENQIKLQKEKNKIEREKIKAQKEIASMKPSTSNK